LETCDESVLTQTTRSLICGAWQSVQFTFHIQILYPADLNAGSIQSSTGSSGWMQETSGTFCAKPRVEHCRKSF